MLQIPVNNFFPDSGKKSFLILHGTAGGSSATEVAEYFKGTEGSSNPVASNYIVDQAGQKVQCVQEKDGAYAQGVVTNPNWLGNPNLYCLSIEHVKASTDNSDALTPAQSDASFALIKDICQRNGIGMHPADNTTGIASHADIDPINRARCPGAFPWDALWAYLGGDTMTKKYQEQAALDCWSSVLQLSNGGIPPTGTGIYDAWKKALFEGLQYGPPISHEYASIDWNGKAIVVQEFAHARCEWVNGSPNWYSFTGKV